MRVQGVYRKRSAWSHEEAVRVVREGGVFADMPRSRYEASGYDPPFEALPWRSEFCACRAAPGAAGDPAR